MRTTRQFAVALILLLGVASLAPCLLSAQNTARAHACCHEMKTVCQTPASSSCCKAAPQSEQVALLDAKTLELGTVIPAVAIAVVEMPVSQATAWFPQAEHSPPQAPPSILSSLRV